MDTAARERQLFRIQKRRRWLWPVALLLLVPVAGWGKEKPGLLAGIAARSFETHTVKNILGRSTHRQPAGNRQAEKRLRSPSPQRHAMRVDAYRDMIEQYSALHGLDPDLVRAVIAVESDGDPLAVSARGAAGLMQLMPGTAAQLGVEDIFDPEQNIASGTRYLRTLLDRFRSVEVALWAYNAGPGAVKRNRMPAETETYVPKVLKLRHYFKTRTD